MDERPSTLVSVIICFLNEETFLPEAIESVLNQNYANWELVLVDDGSTDRSPAIAKSYTESFRDRIRLVEHPDHANRGLSASRNAGVSQSQGRLLAFLDADDVWLAGRLSESVKTMAKYPEAGMVVEASRYWRTWDVNKHQTDEIVPVGVKQDALYFPGELSANLYPLARGAAPCPCSITVRREAFDRAAGFEERFKGIYALYEDQAFFAKIYLKEPVFVSSACNCLYRQRTGSIVQCLYRSDKYDLIRSYFLEWLENYLATEGIRNAEADRLLRKNLFPHRFPRTYALQPWVRKLGRRSMRSGSFTHKGSLPISS